MGCYGAAAQVPFFERSYGKAGVDICFSVRQLPDSSVYLFGYSETSPPGNYDFTLMKVKADGTHCWTRYYGTPLLDFGLFMNRSDSFNLILIGTSQNTNQLLGDDVLLIKVDSSGQELWRQSIGTTGNESCRYVEQTHDKGYIFCGITPDTAGSNNAWVVKTDSMGNVEWTNNFGGPDNDVAARVVATSDTSWAMTCDTKLAGNGSYDVQIIGLDSYGNETFNHIHNDSLTNGCQGMFYSSTGRIVSFGETEISPNSYFDFLIHVFDGNGMPVREITFGGTGAEAMFDMMECVNGDYLGTGYTNSSSGGVLPINAAVVRMDTLGNVLWIREFGGSGIDLAYSIVPALGGGYYVAGRTTLADEEFYLLHIDENGLAALPETSNPILKGLGVYPNPANQSCMIQVPFPASIWKIFSLDGKLIFSEQGPALSNKILDISRMQSGSYLVQAEGAGRFSSAKLMIVH